MYFTGHGGDGFLKFHDKEEMAYADFAAALADAHAGGRYGRAVVVADTCQAASVSDGIGIVAAGSRQHDGNASAASLADAFVDLLGLRRAASGGDGDGSGAGGGGGDAPDETDETSHAPGTLVLASSVTGQNSYAFGHDAVMGLALADGFSRIMHDTLVQAFGFRGTAAGTWRAAAAATADGSPAADGAFGAGSPTLGDLCTGMAERGAAHPTARACGWLRRQSPREVTRHGWRGAADTAHAPVAAALHEAAAVPRARPAALSLTLSALMAPEWRVASTVVARDGAHVPLGGAGGDAAGRGAGAPDGGAAASEALLRYFAHAASVRLPAA